MCWRGDHTSLFRFQTELRGVQDKIASRMVEFDDVMSQNGSSASAEEVFYAVTDTGKTQTQRQTQTQTLLQAQSLTPLQAQSLTQTLSLDANPNAYQQEHTKQRLPLCMRNIAHLYAALNFPVCNFIADVRNA